MVKKVYPTKLNVTQISKQTILNLIVNILVKFVCSIIILSKKKPFKITIFLLFSTMSKEEMYYMQQIKLCLFSVGNFSDIFSPSSAIYKKKKVKSVMRKSNLWMIDFEVKKIEFLFLNIMIEFGSCLKDHMLILYNVKCRIPGCSQVRFH